MRMRYPVYVIFGLRKPKKYEIYMKENNSHILNVYHVYSNVIRYTFGYMISLWQNWTTCWYPVRLYTQNFFFLSLLYYLHSIYPDKKNMVKLGQI